MKKSVLFLATLFLFSLAHLASAQSPLDKVYEKYAGQEGFTAVNLNKEMFQMFQKMSTGDSPSADM